MKTVRSVPALSAYAYQKPSLLEAQFVSSGHLYNFGDGWEHTVKVERIADAVPGLAYPVLIDAVGRCPPEDVGGSWGYAEFLDALADPAHENHAEMKEWAGEDFRAVEHRLPCA